MKKTVTMQVNASDKGLGATLIQDNGPNNKRELRSTHSPYTEGDFTLTRGKFYVITAEMRAPL